MTPHKEITAARLRDLLARLKPDDTLKCNGVGNLAIYRAGQYLGFVDFGIAQDIEIAEPEAHEGEKHE